MELATNNNGKLIATEETGFVEDIKQIVASAKTQAYRAANLMQVASNWLLGWRIVEQMQHGKEKAEYGTYVIKLASKVLTEEFGTGYSIQTLKFYRQFYLTFKHLPIGSTVWSQSKGEICSTAWSESQNEKGSILWSQSPTLISQTASDLLVKIGQTLPAQLTWSHFKRLMRVEDEQARMWYMHEAASQQWSYRTLDRNISSQYYYRLLKTPDKLKHEVIDEMQNLTADYQKDKYAFIKNPIVAEFLVCRKMPLSPKASWNAPSLFISKISCLNCAKVSLSLPSNSTSELRKTTTSSTLFSITTCFVVSFSLI